MFLPTYFSGNIEILGKQSRDQVIIDPHSSKSLKFVKTYQSTTVVRRGLFEATFYSVALFFPQISPTIVGYSATLFFKTLIQNTVAPSVVKINTGNRDILLLPQ